MKLATSILTSCGVLVSSLACATQYYYPDVNSYNRHGDEQSNDQRSSRSSSNRYSVSYYTTPSTGYSTIYYTYPNSGYSTTYYTYPSNRYYNNDYSNPDYGYYNYSNANNSASQDYREGSDFQRNSQNYSGDLELLNRVQNAIERESGFNGNHIFININNQKIILRGRVHSQKEAQKIENIVRDITGSNDIDNRLRITDQRGQRQSRFQGQSRQGQARYDQGQGRYDQGQGGYEGEKSVNEESDYDDNTSAPKTSNGNKKYRDDQETKKPSSYDKSTSEIKSGPDIQDDDDDDSFESDDQR